MLSFDLLTRILAVSQEGGADFAEIYVENSLSNNLIWEAGRMDTIQVNHDFGLGIRLLKGGRTLYLYTNDITPSQLLDTAKKAAELSQTAFKEENLNLTCPLNMLPAPAIFAEYAPEPLEPRLKYLQTLDKIARSTDARIVQTTFSAAWKKQTVQLLNSLGVKQEYQRRRARISAQLIAREHAVTETAFLSFGGTDKWDWPTLEHMEKDIKLTVDKAITLLTAPEAKAGKTTVIMTPEAGGTMVHEACGHGLELDLVRRQSSAYQNKLGQKVARTNVSVIDDATLPDMFGSYAFDDEGVPAQKTCLIENGVLINYMCDQHQAWQEKQQSTGNGRRQSWRHLPIPRMSNTFIAPGTDNLEDMIADTKQGLLIKQMGGGQVNTAIGDFVFEVKEAYMIENGHITTPVKGATLIGNGPEVLQKIDAVGSEIDYRPGMCGKNGQSVPVGTGQPAIRIPDLTVGSRG